MRYMAHEAMTDPKYASTKRALKGATEQNLNATQWEVEKNFEAPRFLNPRSKASQKAYQIGPTSSLYRPSANSQLAASSYQRMAMNSYESNTTIGHMEFNSSSSENGPKTDRDKSVKRHMDNIAFVMRANNALV